MSEGVWKVFGRCLEGSGRCVREREREREDIYFTSSDSIYNNSPNTTQYNIALHSLLSVCIQQSLHIGYSRFCQSVGSCWGYMVELRISGVYI